jgi:hypothetical protein
MYDMISQVEEDYCPLNTKRSIQIDNYDQWNEHMDGDCNFNSESMQVYRLYVRYTLQRNAVIREFKNVHSSSVHSYSDRRSNNIILRYRNMISATKLFKMQGEVLKLELLGMPSLEFNLKKANDGMFKAVRQGGDFAVSKCKPIKYLQAWSDMITGFNDGNYLHTKSLDWLTALESFYGGRDIYVGKGFHEVSWERLDGERDNISQYLDVMRESSDVLHGFRSGRINIKATRDIFDRYAETVSLLLGSYRLLWYARESFCKKGQKN